jgi:hypothetical protein
MTANRRCAIAVFLLVVSLACSRRGAAPETAALEKQFQESLNGATLVGHFTSGDNTRLREEKYTIEKISKVGGETWLFHARIQYGERDVTLPIPLTVKWAGDTPMITMTDLSIPGLGTYTARVFFYRGQYAGTWSAKDHGGHLFGRIVKSAAGGG